jgi:hypothetical protein
MLAWSSRPVDITGQVPNSDVDPYEHYEPPKKKVDAIAEAWGIHEPEPFEEFFAGGGNSRPDGDTPTSSIYAGKEGSRTGANGRRRDNLREVYRGQDDDEIAGRVANRRSALPPPQPIFVPDSQSDIDLPQGALTAGVIRQDGPKRSKSIMQRIRKMRDAPNIPISDDSPAPSSPTSFESANTAGGAQPNVVRPTHRSQHSFLGRFAGGRTKDNLGATSENPEAFVYIEDSRNQNKDLPPPPPLPVGDIERSNEVDAGPLTPGLGRKGSLLKRVRGVVKGTK